MPAKAITSPKDLAAAQNAEDLARRAGWAADGLRLYGQTMDARIGEAITAAEAEMTIEGASTITLAAHDPSRSLLKANRFANQKFDVRIDDEWFRLVGVSKQGDQLSLTFEDRAVAWMRQYSTPRKAYRDQVTRAEFILSLVDEVSEGTILVYCPELHKIQPVGAAAAGGGQAADLSRVKWDFVTKAGTYGGPGDSQDNDQPASGGTNRTPGIALNGRAVAYRQPDQIEWCLVLAPNGRAFAWPVTDRGPSASVIAGGRALDVNYTAAREAGYRTDGAFPTDQGKWKVKICGRGDAGRRDAQALAGKAARRPSATAREADAARLPGLADPPRNVTVKGKPASGEQIRNIQTILRVGLSGEFNAPRPVLIAAIMAATQESTMKNLPGGHLDSAGLFQQRPSQGWGTYAQVTNPEVAAAKFFGPAVKDWKANPGQPLNDLVQGVQKSGTPGKFAQWEPEATRTVDAFLADDAITADMTTATAGSATERYAFQRGQNGQREDTWACAGRLAEEVGWRRWMAGGTLFLVSEEDIFASRPRMRVSEQTEGVDWIDFDIVMGRRPSRDRARNASVQEMTVTCRLDAWRAPPGSVVVVEDMGPADGRWLVTQVRWDLFGLAPAVVTLKKPIRELPEPAAETTRLIETQAAAEPASGDAAGLEQVRAGQQYRSPLTGRTYSIPAEHAPNLVWWDKGSIAVAKWIAPQLVWAKSQGWDGQITSGFRTLQHQKDSQGAAVAAAPGTSNHEGSALPRGAIDTPSYAKLRQVLAGWKGPNRLVGGGAVLSNDLVHFSRSGS